MYYRNLEKNKVLGLQASKGNYDASLYLSKDVKADLTWGKNNVDSSFKRIVQPNPDMSLTTDALTKGWGQFMGTENWWPLEFGGARVSYYVTIWS